MTDNEPAGETVRTRIGEKKSLLSGATQFGAVLGLIFGAAAVTVMPISTAGAQNAPSKDAKLSDNIEIVPLPDAVNYVDLTGHGARDVVIRAFWDLGAPNWIFHDTFVTQTPSDNIESHLKNPARKFQIVGIELKKNGPIVDHIDETYTDACQTRSIILYRRKNIIDKTKINTFLISIIFLNRLNEKGDRYANVEKFQLIDWEATHKGTPRYTFRPVDKGGFYDNGQSAHCGSDKDNDVMNGYIASFMAH